MLGKLIDKVLEDKEMVGEEKRTGEERKEGRKFSWSRLRVPLVIFLLALIPRLVYIFVLSDPQLPGWYTDTFHHWQVAYLSKEIGFKQSFLRLWDFKGMEFFWGLLHPLVLAILFWLTGSISILVARLLSTVCGSISIVFLFLLMRRYFNRSTAWAVALLASFFPLTLFSNTVGMQEELGMICILAGFLLWPSRPAGVGILFGLASMVRSEYWLFCFGLAGASLLLKRNFDKAMVLVATYGFFIFLYMKYLAHYTGNYIYPIYWNFLASVKGEWFVDVPIVGEKLLAKRISQGIFGFGVIGAVLTLFRRPRQVLLFLFGFGNIIFMGFMVGFGAYVRGYIPRFWVDRLYNWPYLFTGILAVVFLFYSLPKFLPFFDKLKLNWLLLIAGIGVSQLLWRPINFFSEPMKANFRDERIYASEIAQAYQGGGLLLPEDRSMITYFLAHDFGIKGRNMVGQMFDPFFYFENQEDPFANWGQDREVVFNWLKRENIKLIALTVSKPTYLGLVEREPDWFRKVPGKRVRLYEVEVD